MKTTTRSYWTAPCATLARTNLSVVFANVAYPIDRRDVNMGTLADKTMCVRVRAAWSRVEARGTGA
jgi:hypothetical protein